MEYKDIINELNIDIKEFGELFTVTLGRVFNVQSLFEQNLLQKKSPSVNFKEAQIKIGDEIYDCEVIGTEVKKQAWFWGWTEDQKKFTPKLFNLCKEMKQYGELLQLPYVLNEKYDLPDTNFAHFISGATSSLYNCCYSVFKMENALIFLAVKDAPKFIYEAPDAMRFASICKQALQLYKVDHKLFIQGFLKSYDIPYTLEDNKILIDFTRKTIVELTIKDNLFAIENIIIE